MIISEKTGRALWRGRVDTTPDRAFLRCFGREWTFAAFDAEVQRVAAGLEALGVREGELVLVAMGNRPEALHTQLALQQLGAVFVPLLPGLTVRELSFPITHSGARLLVGDEEGVAEILTDPGRFPALERLVLVGDPSPQAALEVVPFSDVASSEPLAPRPLVYTESSLAMVLYTSGSTGRPKGVMIPAGSAYSVGEAFAERFGVQEDDNYLLPTTLAHAVGSLTALSMVLHRGCRLSVVDRFSPSRFWQDVADDEATFSILFPAHLNLLLEADTGTPEPHEHSLRLVITHAYVERFQRRFGVELATVWGMTETGALCVGSEPGYRGRLGNNYVGTPMEGVEVGVFDDDRAPLPAGEPGEIALRHPHVMLGYYKDEEATRTTLVDGWVRSGDQGLLDAEGRLFFVGRLKNVIKRSGENISAEEVEAAIAEHPDVAECTVFAVPDPIRTEEVAATVVRRPGTVGDPAQIRSACATSLVRWKLPRYLVVRDEPLPRLANGKLDRVALKASLDLDVAWDAEAVESRSRSPMPSPSGRPRNAGT